MIWDFLEFLLSAIFYGLAKSGTFDFPFINRIWAVFLLCIALGVIVSHLTLKPTEGRLVRLGGISFATRKSFNIASIAITLILILLYAVFW